MTREPSPNGAVVLTGGTLTIAELVAVARDPRIQVTLEPAAMRRVARAHEQVHAVVARYGEHLREATAVTPPQDYGITTGFGEFKSIPVAPADLRRLQRNLLLSHATGVGDSPEAGLPSNYYGADVVRATLALRLNTFLRGNSGVSPELVEIVAAMLNAGVVPLVPLRGSVGSSGDLCPLAHLFGVLIGNGSFYTVATPDDLLRHDLPWRSARDDLPALLGGHRLDDLIGPKEGLALTNGAAVSAAMLALVVDDAHVVADIADATVALTLEAICGCARAFDPAIHNARPHPGQIISAANVRALLRGSSQIDRSGAVQDVYSVRCAPQVHGASRQAIEHVADIVEIEINSSTDNPLLFPDLSDPWDRRFEENRPEERAERCAAFSAGNFHGQPVALAADYLAIAVAELADISERRTQMLLDAHHNRNLPANLVALPGLNSGLMIAQYAAAGLVSENKVLAHPAAVDSIPTSANTEDHVSMANLAGRKAMRVLANAQAVLAIELLTAAQAVDWRIGMRLDPTPDRGPAVKAGAWQAIWAEQHDLRARFAEAAAAENGTAVVERLGTGTAALYGAVRHAAGPVVDDRPLDGDIRAIWQLITSHQLLEPIAHLFATDPYRASVAVQGGPA